MAVIVNTWNEGLYGRDDTAKRLEHILRVTKLVRSYIEVLEKGTRGERQDHDKAWRQD